ncbi:unnamed protein product [Rhizophagus irregularis]|nr:unnamed protein product [Rhizophagus irregularis]
MGTDFVIGRLFRSPWTQHFRRFSSSNFCHIPFIKITDDGLGIRQVFWVSGVWTLVDGLDLIFASEGRRLGHETSFIRYRYRLVRLWIFDLVSVPLSGSELELDEIWLLCGEIWDSRLNLISVSSILGSGIEFEEYLNAWKFDSFLDL